MKTIPFLLGVLTMTIQIQVTTSHADEGQPENVPSAYAVTERGAHHRVLERVEYEITPEGEQIPHSHSYTELATGMHYKNANDEWVESKEEIQILPNGTGAKADQGQHKVIFPPNLYDGQIELNTPDNKWLRSRVLGLSYFDSSSGQSVLIAEITNSVGQLHSSNIVVYPDAFTDLRADVRCTYTRAGFEQDIVLREQILAPGEYGLNPETTGLQVLTEFFSPPVPIKTVREVNGSTDEALDFGIMKIGRGKAFALGDETGLQRSVRVVKTWQQLEGRNFLVEEVEYKKIESQLQELPPPIVAVNRKPASGDSVLHRVVSKRVLPAQRLAKQSTNTFQLARADIATKPGYVLDYTTLNSAQTNFTFNGDTTYYISGPLNLYGANVIEGGSVLKFPSNIYAISLYGTLVCKTAPYRPAVFTSKNDDSVGEIISGSSGSPGMGIFSDAYLVTYTSDSDCVLKHIRLSFAGIGVYANGVKLWDVQFVRCWTAVVGGGDDIGEVELHNVLFSGCDQVVARDIMPFTVHGEHVTVDRCSIMGLGASSGYLTNSLLANVTNLDDGSPFTWDGSGNGFYNAAPFGSSTYTNTSYPFRSSGAGNYYLTNGNSFRDVGTTNISPSLLADLKKKTTYPPIILSNIVVTSDTTLSPQAQRDTDIPDLGYHYDPVDYLTCWLAITNGTLTLTEGTAIASYYERGILLSNDCSIVSVGSPLNPNWFVRYSSVQEQPVSLGSGSLMDVQPYHTGSEIPDGTFRFTKFACLSSSSPVFHLFHGSGFVYGNLLVQNCEFWNGTNVCNGDSNLTAKILNNLFNRSGFRIGPPSTNVNLSLSNNLFWNVGLSIQTGFSSNSVFIFNNIFDTCNFGIANKGCINGKNGYINCSAQLNPTNANNIVLGSFNYTNGPLGDFYQVSTNFLDMGNVTADVAGLYHYTTQTNQTKENTSPVDFGYHYVAVNGSGQPIDTDEDGVPDYLEDSNGNGTVNSGETDWQDEFDLGLKVFITRPRNGSTIP